MANTCKTTEYFIERAKGIHKNKYDYSKSEYVDYRTPLTIICPIHGEFQQSPNKHLSKKRGCPKCAKLKSSQLKTKTKEQFILEANAIHNGKYDYSETNYTKAQEKVEIICPIHGKFNQKATDHLQGHGCPKCNQSKLEKELKDILDKENIEYIQQYKLLNSKQSYDFYLPKYNIAIECQGEQHFKPIEYFGGQKEFEIILERDKKKFENSLIYNIKIYYYIKYNILNNIINNNYNIYNINNILYKNNIKENLNNYLKNKFY